MNAKPKILILLISFILIPFFFGNEDNDITIQEIPEISYHEVYYSIVQNDIKFPEIVFAQTLIETGYFTSDLLYSENNLFGMKYPRIRKTTSSGKSKGGYASYNVWTDSVEDYYLWQKSVLKNKNIDSEEDYLKLLGRIYAEDKKYVDKIKWLMNKL